MTEPMNVPAEIPGPPAGRASFGHRLVAALIDSMMMLVVMAVLSVILSNAVLWLIATVGSLTYFAYFEGSASGQTVGKRVMSIRVVDFRSTQRVDMTRALVRQIGKILSSFLCLLGYLWMLWDRDQQTWHDKIATTHVVTTDAYTVPKWPG